MLGETTQEQQRPSQTTSRDKLLSQIVPGIQPPTVIPCICFSSCPSLELYGCSCWSLLQSDSHSCHCFEVPLSPSLLCFSSVSQRTPVPQDESGLLLKTEPFLQVPDRRDVGWGTVPARGGGSSWSPLESPSPLKSWESLRCLCSLLVPILFNRLRLMSQGSGRDQPGCLIKGLQLSLAVWGFV